MIIGIGTDITSVKRIEQSLEKYGDKFLSKYFTEEEISYANKKTNIAEPIAAAWAAKEAVAKALGTGIRGDITMSSISLIRNELGAPSISLSGGALKHIETLSNGKNYRINVSLSHDAGVACGFVVIEAE
ncbi:MAG: holo-ACP synthase [Alphaproteobacteria bacterium]